MAFSRSTLLVFLATFCALLVCSAADAAFILIDPAGVTASSEIPGFNRKDDYIVDHSGLSGLAHTTTPDGYMWLSTGSGYGGVDPNPSVEFDLGAVARYRVASAR